MLDNAIIGCNGSNSPSVELIIGSRKSYTGIIVKNSIAVSVLSENPELKTNKKDKTIHGFGINSIRKIAKTAQTAQTTAQRTTTIITTTNLLCCNRNKAKSGNRLCLFLWCVDMQFLFDRFHIMI